MKRRTLVSLAVTLLLGGGGALLQTQPSAPQGTMARLLPPGAVLALEARDLASLVQDWNGSMEKTSWLASDNYQAFARSRLFLRLEEARTELASAAGLPPDMALLSDVAGRESALGLYDIGNLELVFVTRMPSARTVENALWRARGNYQPREAAGTRFYVRTDTESKRVVAMGVRDDYLILATREDLLAGVLTRIATPGASSAATEGWYARSVAATGTAGDLRLVMNLDALVKVPHFRSYWVHGNAGELAQYSSGVSDLVRTQDGLREERVLLRAAEQPAADEAGGALGRMLGLVPESAGLYRAWTAPSPEDAKDLIVTRTIAPGPDARARDLTAPHVTLGDGVTGSAADLESRIDEETSAPRSAGYDAAALDALVAGATLTAMLHVEATRAGADDVFVGGGSVIALERADDWPQGAAEAALQRLVAGAWTRSSIGMRWVDARGGSEPFSQLEGLEPLAVAERGRLLFISNDPALLALVLGSRSIPAPDVRGQYAAGFRHALERDRFARLMGFIDHAASSGDAHEPPFFSGNLASLSRALVRVATASIVVRDVGPHVSQTVTYGITR